MSGGPAVCACGTVPEAGDVECSLCGRDLGWLQPAVRPPVLSGPQNPGRQASTPAPWTPPQPPVDSWVLTPGGTVTPVPIAGNNLLALAILGVAITGMGIVIGYFAITVLLSR